MTSDGKVNLLEQIEWLESECFHIDAWEEVYRKEGKPLPSGFARRRKVCRALVKTLELLKAFERDFVALVRKKRAVPEVAPGNQLKQTTPTEAEAESVVEEPGA